MVWLVYCAFLLAVLTWLDVAGPDFEVGYFGFILVVCFVDFGYLRLFSV